MAFESSAAGCLGFRRDFLMLSVILSRIGYDSACCWVGEFRAVTTVHKQLIAYQVGGLSAAPSLRSLLYRDWFLQQDLFLDFFLRLVDVFLFFGGDFGISFLFSSIFLCFLRSVSSFQSEILPECRIKSRSHF